MEMPNYRWPSIRTVSQRVVDAAWSFLSRAGTIILATMILVWALLYFPRGDSDEVRFDQQVTALTDQITQLENQLSAASKNEQVRLRQDIATLEEQRSLVEGEWRRQSWLGRAGRWIEPVVRPLGWDWRIGMAVLASFPAREVVVGTLGIVYNVGPVDVNEISEADDPGITNLGRALRSAVWEQDPSRRVFTLPTALSIMVFFALCCQCASTLAVIRRETRSWVWPALTFGYMTALAYGAALATYQIGALISGTA
jgi:ferrous iron transport protein B